MMAYDPAAAPPRKRCKRRNTPGHAHFLTFSCYKRQPFLSKERTCQWLADAITEARRKHPFDVVAYVFMPEHVHLLIRPRERPYRMSQLLQSIKLPVAIRARDFVLRHAPGFIPHMKVDSPGTRLSLRFWQAGGGYDRNIYTPEELWEKIRYIHLNPLRRGLAQHAEEWKWSSASAYAGLRSGPIAVDNHNMVWPSM